MRPFATEAQLDEACFGLSRLLALMEEADGIDYRDRSRAEVAAVVVDLKCAVGRDRFAEGVTRHAEWLRSLGYRDYLRTAAWSMVRYFALRRDGYICCRCGRGRDLEVHHLSYDRLHAERLEDVTVLCLDCHAGSHSGPRRDRVLERRPEGQGLRRMSTILAAARSEDAAQQTTGIGRED